MRDNTRPADASSPSGATYTSSISFASMRAMRSARSSWVRLELRNVAGTPTLVSASTWSFIRAISGETTSVVPPSTRAGIW
jgi:hypothetical protein